MSLTCSKCGAPYTGGFVCERCGTGFSKKEIEKHEKEYREIGNNFMQPVTKNKTNTVVKIVGIFCAVFVGLIILSIIVAIFVPAFIGYKVKRNAAKESMQAENQKVYEEIYNAEYSSDLNFEIL